MFASSRSRYCDMFPRQIRLVRHVRLQPIPLLRHVPRQIPLLRHVRPQPDPLLRHVPPADPATATCSALPDPLLRHVPPADPASATCSTPAGSRYCDMFPRQIRLLRHVRPQPIPLLRHVPRQKRLVRHVPIQPIPLVRHVSPADPATATCSPGRSGYCDMFDPSRTRYCDMFHGQIRLVRHVRPQPIPLLRHVPRQKRLVRHVPIQPIPLVRHVPPADPATATCSPGRSG